MGKWLIIALLLIPLLVVAGGDHDRARALQETGDILSLEQILERVRGEYPGRLLEIELEREDQVWVYEVELLDADGKVWELELDAVSGEILKREQEE